MAKLIEVILHGFIPQRKFSSWNGTRDLKITHKQDKQLELLFDSRGRQNIRWKMLHFVIPSFGQVSLEQCQWKQVANNEERVAAEYVFHWCWASILINVDIFLCFTTVPIVSLNTSLSIADRLNITQTFDSAIARLAIKHIVLQGNKSNTAPFLYDFHGNVYFTIQPIFTSYTASTARNCA